jgi:peptidoglycan/xylan/chitin deacetylase (PgdA/CDA1 family)
MPEKNRRYIKAKYSLAWKAVAAVSFFLYFSGIISLYIFIRRRVFKKHIAAVLMYHRVNDGDDDRDMTVSTANFKKHMEYLSKDFNVVSMDELISMCKMNVSPDRDTAVITFDDGFKDNYTDAYPILKTNGLSATIFVSIKFIDSVYGLDREDIAEMSRGSITIGAHTLTHPVLAEVDLQTAEAEIAGSKSELERITGSEVKYFAYPYGKKDRDFTDGSVDIVRNSGFIAAFSTDNGFITPDNNLFTLNRIGMRDFPLFVLKTRLSGFFENGFIYFIRRLLSI